MLQLYDDLFCFKEIRFQILTLISDSLDRCNISNNTNISWLETERLLLASDLAHTAGRWFYFLSPGNRVTPEMHLSFNEIVLQKLWLTVLEFLVLDFRFKFPFITSNWNLAKKIPNIDNLSDTVTKWSIIPVTHSQSSIVTRH